MCVERVEHRAQDTALWGSYIQGDGVGGELAHFHHLWSAGEEIFKFKFKLSFIVIPLHVWTYSGTRCRASQDHGAT